MRKKTDPVKIEKAALDPKYIEDLKTRAAAFASKPGTSNYTSNYTTASSFTVQSPPPTTATIPALCFLCASDKHGTLECDAKPMSEDEAMARASHLMTRALRSQFWRYNGASGAAEFQSIMSLVSGMLEYAREVRESTRSIEAAVKEIKDQHQ